ncbi:hypothetical protein CYMTET_46888 [Cymbomonas tetramitiformis]|uniref:Uncharacterized protein n=1 Tax=Cymbomonas tetramitiformis TaxID=36881 RepID=A0AAE0BXA3_9CHLO|nr:hypothetical protein CYMTET_46888 [Cymbomonas tetramitiformis]
MGLGRRPWLDLYSKRLRDSDLRLQHDIEMECGHRPHEANLSYLEREADLHAFARQAHDEAGRTFLRDFEGEHWDERVKSRVAAREKAKQAALVAAQASSVYPVAAYLVRDIVQQATATGLLADACTVHLPFNPDFGPDETTHDPSSQVC